MFEVRNKVAAYGRFRRAGAPENHGSGTDAEPSPASRFRRLWAVEGRAFRIGAAAARQRRRENLRHFLHGSSAVAGPVSDALPRHTGAGLGAASVLLEDGSVPVAEVIRRFRGLVDDVAVPACRPAALENLGLAVRLLRPESLSAFAAVVSQDAELAELFWHGVGRGLYFAPSTLWAPDGWPVLRRAVAEPPDDTARCNAVAGAAWALALVNLLQPAVVARRLAEVACAPRWRDCAVHGVASALALWRQATGDETTAGRFLSELDGALAESGAEGRGRQAAATTQSLVAEVRDLLDGELYSLAVAGRLAESFSVGSGRGPGERHV
jgi:hypothetical protein